MTELCTWADASKVNYEMAMRAARAFDRHCHTFLDAAVIIVRERLTVAEIVTINS